MKIGWFMEEVKEAASIPEKTKKLTVLAAYGLGTVTMVVPVYYALTEEDFRAKEFGKATGDNDILGFTSKEESMAFRRIAIKNNMLVTYRSVLELSRCRWLTQRRAAESRSLLLPFLLRCGWARRPFSSR